MKIYCESFIGFNELLNMKYNFEKCSIFLKIYIMLIFSENDYKTCFLKISFNENYNKTRFFVNFNNLLISDIGIKIVI